MAYVDQVINTTEKNDDDLKEEMRQFWEDHSPCDELARIDRRIANFRHNPWHQMYLYNYGTSNYAYREMAESLNQSQKDELLREFYQAPMTPSQVTDRFNQVLSQNHQAA